MKMNFLIIALSLSLTACATKPLIETHYVDKPYPVNAVPHTDMPAKPVLETTKLTPVQRNDIGAFSKAVTVENTQLKEYIGVLELIINTYNDLAKKSVVTSTLVVPGLKTDKPNP